MGEEQLPIPPPNNNIAPDYLFTEPQLPSTSFHLPPFLHQPMIQQSPNQLGMDIDWVSLLTGSASITNGDQMPQIMPNVSSVASGARNTNEGENFGKPKGKGSASRAKKTVPPRVAFHTRSTEDVLDDGYRWRKYGQKAVKNSNHPRSYYRCTHHTCNVKKQIQRLSKDTGIVVTTYEGIHNHPCEKLMETLGPLLKQIQFLTRF